MLKEFNVLTFFLTAHQSLNSFVLIYDFCDHLKRMVSIQSQILDLVDFLDPDPYQGSRTPKKKSRRNTSTSLNTIPLFPPWSSRLKHLCLAACPNIDGDEVCMYLRFLRPSVHK
jgi:hypothetical protein